MDGVLVWIELARPATRNFLHLIVITEFVDCWELLSKYSRSNGVSEALM
jgi:hypothetical protein